VTGRCERSHSRIGCNNPDACAGAVAGRCAGALSASRLMTWLARGAGVPQPGSHLPLRALIAVLRRRWCAGTYVDLQPAKTARQNTAPSRPTSQVHSIFRREHNCRKCLMRAACDIFRGNRQGNHACRILRSSRQKTAANARRFCGPRTCMPHSHPHHTHR